MTTYFCDGLKDVTVLNGIARIEFQRLEAVERGGNRELRTVSEFVIALPLQGLVAAVETLDQVRDRLIAQGAVPAPGAAPPAPPKSPNFS
jgi:hypothetical protein